MSHQYQGNNKYKSKPLRIASQEEVEVMLDALERVMPMSREELVRRSIEKYYHRKITEKAHFNTSSMLIDQKHRCWYCLRLITKRTATVDHKLPVSRGGTHVRENIVLACEPCNNEKDSMTEEEYLEFLGISPTKQLTNTPKGVSSVV